MNELKNFNEALKYIELHLETGVDNEELSRIAACPASLFGRIFTVLSDMPLSEYIRLRRLSRAASELQESHAKVIELALKYGYDSVDAFSAAFRRFHGKRPSEVKKGEPYRVLPPVRFSLKIQGGSEMEVRMEKKEAFKMAGLILKGMPNADFAKLWGDLFNQYTMEELLSLGSGQSYGACYEMTTDEQFSYMAGFDLKETQKAQALGLEVLEVPAATYAVVKLTGPIPRCIREGWGYVMGSFFPQQGYRHAGSPDFEVYFDGDMYAPDYKMELWVPVEKTSQG
ncbi:MAG: AraC family transcriptional regulator [Anaerolineaceae bacterium]|nr:AraC family transcriptional regulator [Anaerolineaceae bacterium]